MRIMTDYAVTQYGRNMDSRVSSADIDNDVRFTSGMANTHETAARALAALATMLGRDTDDWNNPLRIGRGYYSD